MVPCDDELMWLTTPGDVTPDAVADVAAAEAPLVALEWSYAAKTARVGAAGVAPDTGHSVEA